jgi:hypothetical protein
MFKVGDILTYAFQYSARHPHFVRVVRVTPKSIAVEKLENKVVSHDGYGQNGCVVPNLEAPAQPIKGTFRVNEGKYFGEYCKISGCYATLWNGTPEEFYTD